MDDVSSIDAVVRLERSNHTAFLEDNVLHVWGGYQAVSGSDVFLPSDEIWLCDLATGLWMKRMIAGDGPTDLSGFCGSYLNGTLYIFAGCDSVGYTNQVCDGLKSLYSISLSGPTLFVALHRFDGLKSLMWAYLVGLYFRGVDVSCYNWITWLYSVDLREQCYRWKRVTDTNGNTPSPRNKHSCWVHKERLIYFGGYGCKTVQEVRNATTSFVVEETSWTVIGTTYFRCWGWNNEVNIFDTSTATWSIPETKGPAPAPRGCHASALLGNKGYVCGGLETKALDLYSLDLETWTWTCLDLSPACVPLGRSMHTLTPTSDHTLFLFGGLGMDGNPLSDAWQFDTLTNKWAERPHPHSDKPRLWHTACQDKDHDVVVFGGSSTFCILMDSVAVLRSPCQTHCKDVLIFQTQPYPLYRLCEDFMAKNADVLGEQLTWLPPRLEEWVHRRLPFFAASKPKPSMPECVILE